MKPPISSMLLYIGLPSPWGWRGLIRAMCTPILVFQAIFPSFVFSSGYCGSSVLSCVFPAASAVALASTILSPTSASGDGRRARDWRCFRSGPHCDPSIRSCVFGAHPSVALGFSHCRRSLLVVSFRPTQVHLPADLSRSLARSLVSLIPFTNMLK